MAASGHASPLSPPDKYLSGGKTLPEKELLVLRALSATVSLRNSADVIFPPVSCKLP